MGYTDGSKELAVQRGSAPPGHCHQGVSRIACCQRGEQKHAPRSSSLRRAWQLWLSATEGKSKVLHVLILWKKAQQEWLAAAEGISQENKNLFHVLAVCTKYASNDSQQQKVGHS